MKLVLRVRRLQEQRCEDFYFAGKITPERDWLRSFNGVKESNRGRNPFKKHFFHSEYWRDLRRARFALTPVGELDWSYRFFEAIIAGAIPVVGDSEFDIYADGFRYFRASQTMIFDEAITLDNFRRFISHHTILGLGYCASRQPRSR